MSLSTHIPARTIAVAIIGGSLWFALMTLPAEASGMSEPQKSGFAGYSGNDSAGFTNETATVTLPTISCVKRGTEDSIELNAQTTGGANAVGVSMGCVTVHAVATYSMWVEPAGPPVKFGSVKPKPGDTVTISANCGSIGTSVTVDDVTSDAVLTGTSTFGTGTCHVMSVGSFGDTRGIPEMNDTPWSNVTVDGAPLSSLPLSVSNYFLSRRKATLTTGALTSGGTAFNQIYAPPSR